ncbi:hypothetical protein ACOSQ3_029332 [Xanthoceras sorbifolium]
MLLRLIPCSLKESQYFYQKVLNYILIMIYIQSHAIQISNPTLQFDHQQTIMDETKKKTRGVTRMVTLKVNQPVEVDFNLHGQTIDGSSITLASYIGIFAREHVPITLESWKKVDEQKKDMIWSSLLLLHSSKDYIFKKIGGRWRQYKSRITKKLIEASQ